MIIGDVVIKSHNVAANRVLLEYCEQAPSWGC